MSKVNLRSIDLNLLIILEALLDERNVTRAGERVFLSQPAMSRALGKLRQIFDDPLLVKSGRELILTPRAEALQAELQYLLSSIRKFVAPGEFVPREAAGQVRISASDAMIASFMAVTIKNIIVQAPNVRFILEEPTPNYIDLLRHGHLDVVFYSSPPPDDLHFTELLIDNRISCLLRQDHPLTGKLTRDSYLHAQHIVVENVIGRMIDDYLRKQNGARRVALSSSSYISAAAIAAQTDWIFTVPTVFALCAIKMFDLVMLDPPFSLIDANSPPIKLYLIWHERCNSDALHAWVREMIKKQLEGWRYL